jgi:hypothetical protein
MQVVHDDLQHEFDSSNTKIRVGTDIAEEVLEKSSHRVMERLVNVPNARLDYPA